MNKIRKLSSDIIAKIAAGEVIERPAYAVKELIENAIDAHATAITIHVEESGLRKIQIIDNGEGMSREDLEISFLPHTTSKISDDDELMGIKTLGFRGEALSSIASISNLSIQSRIKKNASGTVVEIRQGRVAHIGSIGMPPGTIVTVDELFSPVPARKKFLKTQKTEFRFITEIILHFALAYPTIHFLLTHNDKTIFDLPVKKDEHQRLSLIFGEDILPDLLPLSFSDSYITLSGHIGKPQTASKNNQRQFLFVNNRAVSDKLISLAIKESFGTLLPSSSSPVFRLHLSLPHEVVDVNVHPRKETVSFTNARMVFDLVKQAVTETLMKNNITYHVDTFVSLKKGETTSVSAQYLKENVLPWNRGDIGQILQTTSFLQIHQTYILAVTKEGILLLDQHAAHERILFQQFTKAFLDEKSGPTSGGKQKNTYTLPKPLTFSFSESEKQLLEEHKNLFEDTGFLFENFGENTFILRNIPSLFKGRNMKKIIRDMLSDLEDQRGIKAIDITSQRMLAFLSCRAAVKANDVLTEKQMGTIVKDLEKSENNSTCPHGRPTRMILPLELIHKYFNRM